MAQVQQVAAAFLAALAGVGAVNPHNRLGPYLPVSDVIEQSQFSYDIRVITNSVHEHDFDTARSVYEGGRYSCTNASTPRSLRDFVKLCTAAQLQGEAYFDSFTGGTGPTLYSGLGPIPGPGRLQLPLDFWDRFIGAALQGTGDFANKSNVLRMVAVKKGILGVVAMHVAHRLESAIAISVRNLTSDGAGAPHEWDTAWAVYYGACGDNIICLAGCVTQGWCRYSAFEATLKRDGDHAYDASYRRVPGTVLGQDAVAAYFLEGQQASRIGSAGTPSLVKSRDNIYRIIALTAIRDTLRYAYAMNRGAALKYPDLNDLLHMQAYAYFLAAAGWIEQAAPGAGKAVLDLIDFRRDTASIPLSVYCDVMAALTPAYGPLGLDCAKIGRDWAIPPTSCPASSACTSVPELPKGLTGLKPDTTTLAGHNVDCGHALPRVSTARSTTHATTQSRTTTWV